MSETISRCEMVVAMWKDDDKMYVLKCFEMLDDDGVCPHAKFHV